MGSLKTAALGGSTIPSFHGDGDCQGARSLLGRFHGTQECRLASWAWSLRPGAQPPPAPFYRGQEFPERQVRCGRSGREAASRDHPSRARAHPVGSCRWHCAPDWALSLLGRLPCGGRCSLTFRFSPPLPFAPSLPLPMTGHRTWSP